MKARGSWSRRFEGKKVCGKSFSEIFIILCYTLLIFALGSSFGHSVELYSPSITPYWRNFTFPEFSLKSDTEERVSHRIVPLPRLSEKQPKDIYGTPDKQLYWWTEDADPSAEDLKGTAIVTLVAGDDSARHAVVLFQSIINTNTKVPNLYVLLSQGGTGSADCRSDESRRRRNRTDIRCDSSETIAVEIASQIYLDAFDRMGVKYEVISPIKRGEYTKHIPGGPGSSWGMAFNKLKVFGLVQFSKILFLDSDVMILRNIDHLLLKPHFTGAFTTDCCNRNVDYKLSGGMWILEPSLDLVREIEELTSHPVPGTQDGWHFGDMQVVLYLFANITPSSQKNVFPYSRDANQGLMKGLRIYPNIREKTDAELAKQYSGGFRPATILNEGLVPAAEEIRKKGGKVWNTLDPRYDGLVGNCECIPERDIYDSYYSVHFSCTPVYPPLSKPGHYYSEKALLEALYTNGFSCMRRYYLMWYENYQQAMNMKYPAPYYDGPEVRVDEPGLDAKMVAYRTELHRIEHEASLKRAEERKKEEAAKAQQKAEEAK